MTFRIESVELDISPVHQLDRQRDVYGNAVAQVTFLEPASSLSSNSCVLIQHYDDQPLNFLVVDYAVSFPFQNNVAEGMDLEPYLSAIFEQDQPLLRSWLRQFWVFGQVVETYLLLEWINKKAIRDFATLLIKACRFLELATRFVNGYLDTSSLPQGQGCNPCLV